MSTIREVLVPDIGTLDAAPVVEVLVAAGDSITVGETLIILESDKATLDIPSDASGIIEEVKVKMGDALRKGSVILTVSGSSNAEQPVENSGAPVDKAAALPDPQPLPDPTAISPSAEGNSPAPQVGKPVYASPSLRRYARILGVDIRAVTGSGPKGRIVKSDVEGFVKSKLSVNTHPQSTGSFTGLSTGTGLPTGLPAWPQVDFASFGPVEAQPLSRIARLSGPALARNALLIPHVCNFDEADVTALDAFRNELNAEAGPDTARLTLLAFAVKAIVATLKKHPKFNSSLDGDNLILKRYWNIGVAADTPNGLVVPVIKKADQKGLYDIATEMAALAEQARAGRLKAADMQGASFTISSLGGIGGTNFTPIINAPEVAILGMTRAKIQPVWDGSAFQPRLVQPLSLSWDHRAVDGVAAARFLGDLAAILGDFRRISL
ncbi:Dihydrolipoyllysine-residue acetyltransferase component of pyruvate dehydrogenase complex [Phaeobacter sp. CECT 5382]|uniref:2-oxo acid dehydrogenase subunit E2 n=1 Tax=Phaeobacter sp. CECT 5382 TaxID=1712645 RepID=UPI0006DB7F54|nr:2-oxo acid dehydrogenase subunit E2 [Phaeobacter sp. CECT 5382]CUH87552.1 Dihydrolipoyllysine-residue acetyltransferase component of pyruvate dehydrogenase complex [Phaeobacter sp. CECT 5382]